jgi:hypothetical protein
MIPALRAPVACYEIIPWLLRLIACCANLLGVQAAQLAHSLDVSTTGAEGIQPVPSTPQRSPSTVRNSYSRVVTDFRHVISGPVLLSCDYSLVCRRYPC